MGTGQLQKGLETAAVLPRISIPGLLAAPSQVQTEEDLRLSVKQANPTTGPGPTTQWLTEGSERVSVGPGEPGISVCIYDIW